MAGSNHYSYKYANSYGDVPEEFKDPYTARVVILPVPYDGTSTWIKGADKGPESLLNASANMELYDIECDAQVYEVGIFTDAPVTENASPKSMVDAVRGRVERHLADGRFVGVIGGEHSVSIGAIEAHANRFEDLTVLQLDAHGDLRDEYDGSPYNHACVMARARQRCPIAQVGIRSMCHEEKDCMDPGRALFCDMPGRRDDWPEKVVSMLSARVYLTLDLDVFDPAIMPSTGTPEPGGLGWYEVLQILKRVIERRELVGFDIVELRPNPANPAPDFLAAKLVYKILTYKFTS